MTTATDTPLLAVPLDIVDLAILADAIDDYTEHYEALTPEQRAEMVTAVDHDEVLDVLSHLRDHINKHLRWGFMLIDGEE